MEKFFQTNQVETDRQLTKISGERSINTGNIFEQTAEIDIHSTFVVSRYVRKIEDSLTATAVNESEELRFGMWKNLPQEEIKKTKTHGQRKEAYYNSPPNSKIRRTALIKWIPFCTTPEQIKEAYVNATLENGVEKIALEKWKRLSLKEIKKATTLEQIKKAFNNTPANSEVRKMAIIKWMPLCINSEQIKEVYINSIFEIEIEKMAFERWNVISLEEIKKATTQEKIKEAFYNTPPDSEAKRVALIKWIPLCVNFEQIREAFYNSPFESETRRMALNRWIPLCTNSKQIKEVYFNAITKDEIKKVLKSWNRLSLEEIKKAKTQEKIKEAFYNAPPDSRARKIALKKIA